MLARLLHRAVVEIDGHDDDAHVPAQRRTLRRRRAHGLHRRADRELVGRDDDAVVEAESPRMRPYETNLGQQALASHRVELP